MTSAPLRFSAPSAKWIRHLGSAVKLLLATEPAASELIASTAGRRAGAKAYFGQTCLRPMTSAPSRFSAPSAKWIGHLGSAVKLLLATDPTASK